MIPLINKEKAEAQAQSGSAEEALIKGDQIYNMNNMSITPSPPPLPHTSHKSTTHKESHACSKYITLALCILVTTRGRNLFCHHIDNDDDDVYAIFVR